MNNTEDMDKWHEKLAPISEINCLNDKIDRLTRINAELLHALKWMSDKFSRQGLHEGYEDVWECAIKAIASATEKESK